MAMATLRIRRFEAPDERRDFPLGQYELLQAGGLTIGRAEYEPGWRWSEHVGKDLGKASCDVPHLGLVLAGRNRIEMDDGRTVEVGPGDVFEIGPGHDSVVVGDERYVSIHLLGADRYSAR
jgi:quercetin dioxygenase-like cupin family protein